MLQQLYHRNISIILPSPQLEKSKNYFIFKSLSILNEFIQNMKADSVYFSLANSVKMQ